MSQNKSQTALTGKLKLSPLGWIIAGAIVVLFWESLLGIGLIILAGYWLCKHQARLLKWGRDLLHKLFPPTSQDPSK